QKEVERLNRLWPEFIAKNNEKKKNTPTESVDINRALLKRPHEVTLDTIEIKAHGKNPKEYVIYGWGRSDCYEFYLDRLATDALNLNKRIISFNFRGVAHSVGQVYCEHDLINDYAFQVQRLLDKGVKPEHIKCYGHSLCGAIATFSVADLIQKHKSIKFYNDRSFANLIDTSTALYFKRKNSRRRIVNTATIVLMTVAAVAIAALTPISLLNLTAFWMIAALSTRWSATHGLYDKTVGNLLESIMIGTMRYGGWELKAAKKYDEIPFENKSHTVIKQPKKKFSTLLGRRKVKSAEPSHDRVILYPDSKHFHLNKYHATKQQLAENLKAAKKKGNKALIEDLTGKLVDLSNAKMTGGGHMDDPKEFVTWYKSPRAKRHLTGQERFYAFVDPQGNHEGPVPRKYKTF
ncbi:MAG: hypothetical protein AB7V32_11275, partial [Candidatus Berkiella sp.]